MPMRDDRINVDQLREALNDLSDLDAFLTIRNLGKPEVRPAHRAMDVIARAKGEPNTAENIKAVEQAIQTMKPEDIVVHENTTIHSMIPVQVSVLGDGTGPVAELTFTLSPDATTEQMERVATMGHDLMAKWNRPKEDTSADKPTPDELIGIEKGQIGLNISYNDMNRAVARLAGQATQEDADRIRNAREGTELQVLVETIYAIGHFVRPRQ